MIAALLAALVAVGAPDDRAEARALFQAAGRLFEAGKYADAARFMERAYAKAPSPELAFSLAQAHRLQYFVDLDVERLGRAIALYRVYLSASPTGARRRDAAELLAELVPIAERARAGTAARSPPAAPPPAPTELIVTGSVRGATVTVDGGPGAPLPAVLEVSPGPHVLRVSHDLHRPRVLEVMAVAGRSLPVEVTLEPRSGEFVWSSPEAGDVLSGGRRVGATNERIPLDPGEHDILILTPGHLEVRDRIAVQPGEQRELYVDPAPKLTRTLGRAGLITSAALGLTAVALAGWALANDAEAGELLAQREQRALTPTERSDYERSVSATGDLTSAAVIVAGAAAGLAGLSALSWVFD